MCNISLALLLLPCFSFPSSSTQLGIGRRDASVWVWFSSRSSFTWRWFHVPAVAWNRWFLCIVHRSIRVIFSTWLQLQWSDPFRCCYRSFPDPAGICPLIKTWLQFRQPRRSVRTKTTHWQLVSNWTSRWYPHSGNSIRRLPPNWWQKRKPPTCMNVNELLKTIWALQPWHSLSHSLSWEQISFFCFNIWSSCVFFRKQT